VWVGDVQGADARGAISSRERERERGGANASEKFSLFSLNRQRLPTPSAQSSFAPASSSPGVAGRGHAGLKLQRGRHRAVGGGRRGGRRGGSRLPLEDCPTCLVAVRQAAQERGARAGVRRARGRKGGRPAGPCRCGEGSGRGGARHQRHQMARALRGLSCLGVLLSGKKGGFREGEGGVRNDNKDKDNGVFVCGAGPHAVCERGMGLRCGMC
jgi:hypothetical protein